MFKKLMSMAMIATLVLGVFTGCGSSTKDSTTTTTGTTETAATTEAATTETATTEATAEVVGKGGTIMWLSNLSSGMGYDTAVNYATMVCKELGYEFQVVYGDAYNDPAANLTAVKNGMTKDVVAIIMSQDGGVKDIMAEYPDLYVAGYNTDMASVYTQDGASAEVATNAKFLGTICDGNFDGNLTGIDRANEVIARGYTKVATMIFPAFAYPQATVEDQAFRATIADYNKTAADDKKIEIVGDAKVLEFAPLDESYFLEEGNGDLDAIVGMLAGADFVYPAMKSAMANGTCSKDTKLITAGLNTDEAILADMNDGGVIQSVVISPAEDIAWALVMIDNALIGKPYADYTTSQRVNSLPYLISGTEDVNNVMTKSLAGTADVSLAQISMDDLKKVLTRYNESATFADLDALFHSEQLSVAALKSR